MAYKITEDCTMCGTCASECSSQAISEGNDRYVIDNDICTECGTCIDVCPAEAIVEV
ncbi:MAG TPA: 4Fe-4S binding protein [Spirochaetota bacterium]|jgi:ferredoxin|nr:4Fe-4S binding protein [Spirochaetota bacterium]HOT20526.1 4Fe-4S binding protein [Spirochaetota bacterium]HPK45567.1 4Fe-4S binding protein [Spirochaetota bacterium]HQI38811.1 4Fe-4S binding protein [Spirochaetota bacterium]HQK07859.1 4Fe-4S binding protein [Spirochaetota bacterium]